MMRSDNTTSGPQGGKTMKTKTKPQTTRGAGVATNLPAGTVEAQHQITGQPFVPGSVPTKKAPGIR